MKATAAEMETGMPMLSALDRCLICGDYSGVLALGWRLEAVDMVCRSLYFTREYLRRGWLALVMLMDGICESYRLLVRL